MSSMISFLISTIKKLRRVYDFAKLGLYNYDFDYIYFYKLILFKLKRMHKDMLDREVVEEKVKYIKAIRVAIKLCEKIIEDDFNVNLNNVEIRRHTDDEIRAAIIADDNMKKRYYDTFHRILAKYSRFWWT